MSKLTHEAEQDNEVVMISGDNAGGSRIGSVVQDTQPKAAPRRSDATVILDALLASVEGARGAVLASNDGFGCARSSSMADEASHAAMLGAAVGLARQLAVHIGGGTQLHEVVVEHDAGGIVVWPVGSGRVLAILTEPGVDLNQVRVAAGARAAWLETSGAA
jgi:predicted regulator of Ras-like GTPase activity (Roadblock/LC7/MglB family)